MRETERVCVPLSAEEIERTARRAYSELAPEYYDERHVTSRNFDFLIKKLLVQEPWMGGGGPSDVWLEVGCGESKLIRALPPNERLVLLDSSSAMLKHSLQGSWKQFSAVTGSAFAIPFRSGIFSGVFASLGDPFTHPAYFAEARRVIGLGGRLLHIVPAVEWGAPLRQFQRAPVDCSHFFRGDHDSFAPSLLRSKAELRQLAANAGFKHISIDDLFLPSSLPLSDVSPDIHLSARVQSKSVYEIPILAVLRGMAT
jgi:hypothetical protein